MKLIIDIPEENYKEMYEYGNERVDFDLKRMIQNGTPLDTHDEKIIATTVESIWGKPPYTELLDKIRAEIEEQKNDRCFDDDDMYIYMTGLNDAIDIIDKYRNEESNTDAGV